MLTKNKIKISQIKSMIIFLCCTAILFLPNTVFAENSDISQITQKSITENSMPETSIQESMILPLESFFEPENSFEPVFSQPVQETQPEMPESSFTESSFVQESYDYESEQQSSFFQYYEYENNPPEDYYIQNYYSYYAQDSINDYNDWYYSQSPEPEESIDESSFPQDFENSVDTNELTSQDWENLRKGQTQTSKKETSSLKLSSQNSNGEFAEIKETESTSNDVWQYLIAGIALIILGAALLTAIIIINLKEKKKAEN